MNRYGPGPIIHGQDITDPTRFIVQLPDGTVAKLTPGSIAAIPIRRQWFTGTVNGLIASWWDRDTAEQAAAQRGVILGQMIPVNPIEIAKVVDARDYVVILTDPNGQPLKGTLA